MSYKVKTILYAILSFILYEGLLVLVVGGFSSGSIGWAVIALIALISVPSIFLKKTYDHAKKSESKLLLIFVYIVSIAIVVAMFCTIFFLPSYFLS